LTTIANIDPEHYFQLAREAMKQATGLEEPKVEKRLLRAGEKKPTGASVRLVIDSLEKGSWRVKRIAVSTVRAWLRRKDWVESLISFREPFLKALITFYTEAKPRSAGPYVSVERALESLARVPQFRTEFSAYLPTLEENLETLRSFPDDFQRAGSLIQHIIRQLRLEKPVAEARIRAELKKLTPFVVPSLVGIGPSQARQHGKTLEVIASLASPEIHRKIFVVASDATQAKALSDAGLLASNYPETIVSELNEQFPEGLFVPIYYYATPLEGLDFLKILEWWPHKRFSLIEQEPTSLLRDFLQRLLANLMGVHPEQVPDRVNIDQLTRDIDLLLKA